MNASEKLQAVVKARLEGQVFGWGPILAVWGGVTMVRQLADVAWGPSLVAGWVAGGTVVLFQLLWPRFRPTGIERGWPLQGLWLLLAAASWFFGSAAPYLGLLSPVAGAVLELLFLAGGLLQTGFLKSQLPLIVSGTALGAASVVLAAVPGLLGWQALAVGLAFGLPASRNFPARLPK